MMLTLREMRRNPVRFGLLAVAIGLLLFLVLFQQALQSGLITSFVGALRNQTAPVIVYSVDGQRILQGSIVTPDLEAAVLGADGIGTAARAGQGTFTVSIDGEDDVDASILGTSDLSLGLPATLSDGRFPEAPGEAVGSDEDFAVGDQVAVQASTGEPRVITVVGVAPDVQLSVTPTLFTDLTTYEEAVRAVNPDAQAIPINALLLAPASGITDDELVQRVNAATPEADAVTRSEAADTTPGVAQVRQSFQIIFLLYGLVVPLVTGLFFLIVTLQKSKALTLLRAIGARASTLAGALLLQVVLVTLIGVVVGVGLYSLLTGNEVGGLSLRYDERAVTVWTILFLVLAVIGALASLRRVLRIDPIEATTGAGGR